VMKLVWVHREMPRPATPILRLAQGRCTRVEGGGPQPGAESTQRARRGQYGDWIV